MPSLVKFFHFFILLRVGIRFITFDDIIDSFFDFVYGLFDLRFNEIDFDLLIGIFPLQFSELTAEYINWYKPPKMAIAMIATKYMKKVHGKVLSSPDSMSSSRRN